MTSPQLNGTHFRITVVEQKGFVNFERKDDGSLAFSGYVIDILNTISKEDYANFTFDLYPPSGYGSMCLPRGNISSQKSFLPEYSTQYTCGESDVTDLPKTSYTTDFYLSLFYIIPRRHITSRFTMAFSPPMSGANQMYGTAINLRSIEDFVEQQRNNKQGPACVTKGAAYVEFLTTSFPSLQLIDIAGTDEAVLQALKDGTCEVIIMDYPVASQFIFERARNGECLINGKPVGLIGRPLSFGPSQYGIGIRKDISPDVVDTLSFWLNVLMTCSPEDRHGFCRGDNITDFYVKAVGTGEECGYVGFPPVIVNDLRSSLVIAFVLGAVVLCTALCTALYLTRLKEQRHRIRKRFVQQIARNIAIGPSPGSIPVQKLAEEVQHIGDKDGAITKEALRKWISDVKLEFISTRDFEALWTAMDADGKGTIDPVEFFVFLSSCGPQFEEVYEEEQKMPKLERLKLAARRLENINVLGEEGVRRMEKTLDRDSRRNIYVTGPSNDISEHSEHD